MTGSFYSKSRNGVTDTLAGDFFKQRTQICRTDVCMPCNVIEAQGTVFKVFFYILDLQLKGVIAEGNMRCQGGSSKVAIRQGCL